MKLLINNSHLQKLQKKRNNSKRKKELRRAGVRKKNLHNKVYLFKQIEKEIKNNRVKFLKIFYSAKKRTNKEEIFKITESFGLEKDLTSFIQISKQICSLDASKIKFDLSGSGRIWPSGITVFCSLVHWLSLTKHPSQSLEISSSDPYNFDTRSYLSFSGFYDYVGRATFQEQQHNFDNNHIVKIRRETERSKINDRENEILYLIKKYADLSEEQIESFVDNVLIEVFNNATEHGISYKDSGWWTISQYHPTSKIISVCIADNGIGIKNTLLTGPQHQYLKEKLNKNAKEEDFLKLALTNNISGAVTASVIKDALFSKGKGAKGTRRGQGLKIIQDTCVELNIRFVLLSRKGYIENQNGFLKSNSYNSDIFAGTMYHFTIPAKGKQDENN